MAHARRREVVICETAMDHFKFFAGRIRRINEIESAFAANTFTLPFR